MASRIWSLPTLPSLSEIFLKVAASSCNSALETNNYKFLGNSIILREVLLESSSKSAPGTEDPFGAAAELPIKAECNCFPWEFKLNWTFRPNLWGSETIILLTEQMCLLNCCCKCISQHVATKEVFDIKITRYFFLASSRVHCYGTNAEYNLWKAPDCTDKASPWFTETSLKSGGVQE